MQLGPTSGRLNYDDTFTKSLYMIGKIYEQRGNNAKAMERYKKFIDHWKNAGPGIAELRMQGRGWPGWTMGNSLN